MKTTENITNVTNTLRYIWLLPEDEQPIELDNIIQHLKKINKNNSIHRVKYRKMLKQIMYISRLKGIIQIFMIYYTQFSKNKQA